MDVKEYALKITGEIERAVSDLSYDDCLRFAGRIKSANRIFLAGAGRSGFMVKAFAMRLMHMGLKAHLVGETTTPGIEKGDLLIIGSGSGETASLAVMAQKAKKIGVDIALVTIHPQSSASRRLRRNPPWKTGRSQSSQRVPFSSRACSSFLKPSFFILWRS